MKKFLLVPLAILTILCQAQTNYAISFDGTNDFVSIPHSAALNLSNFTFEAWIKLASNSGTLTILSKGEGGTAAITNYVFNVGSNASNGKLGLFAGGAWYSATTALSTGTWYHAAVTVSGTAVNFYLNGVNDGTATLSSAMYTGGTYLFKIGEQGDGCNCNQLNGMIDEVRVWNTARTQTEIKTYMFNKNLSNSATSLVAYYRLNEGSGTSAGNSCTNTTGIDGTLTNGPAWQPSPVQFAANALNFDGANDVVVIPHSVSSDFTVEYWINTTFTGSGGAQWYNGNGIVDAEIGGVTNDWGTSLVSNKIAFGIGNPDITLISTAVVNTGSWVHVAATWKQSTGAMNLYINGNLDGTTTGSTNLRNVPTQITLGELQTNIQFFNGSIDELRIWNVVRSQAAIQANMNNEVDPSVETNLVAYYTFNQCISSGANTGLTILIDQKNTNNGTLNNFALSGSSSNYIAQNGSLVILPMQWLNFTAKRERNNVLLNWATASEQNTKDFIILHSSNGVDWNNRAIVAAAGNSSTINYYSYVHSTPADGINYYRILQRDLDGRFSYSDIRSVKFTNENLPFTVLVNPVANHILALQVNRATTLSLYAFNGNLLWKKQFAAGATTIDMGSYAKGVYLLKANGHSETIILR